MASIEICSWLPGMTMDPPPFVDTVGQFQGQERDLILQYVVADRDLLRLKMRSS